MRERQERVVALPSISSEHIHADDRAVVARNATLALGLLTLVAFNLRTGLIGVGPILPDVTNDLHLTHTQGSLLVALPPALMGLAAPPGGRLVDRFGVRSVITVGLALVAIAGGLRATASVFPVLVLLTAIFGIGSGDIEYAADVVLFLTPNPDRSAIHPARAVDLTVGKNRNGDTGRVDLIFRPDVGTLREQAKY